MNNKIKMTLSILFAATLAACGGGSDSATGSPSFTSGNGSSAGVAVTMSAPTATVLNLQATANDFTVEAKTAAASASLKTRLIPLPLLPGLSIGVTAKQNCLAGGTFTVSAPSSLATGALYSFAFDNCSFVPGLVYNGSSTVRVDSYTSPTNYAWTAGLDFRLTTPGNADVHYSANESCIVNSPAFTCLSTDGTRIFLSDFIAVNGEINGSYLWKYGSNGTVTYTFAHWTATSGSITVVGANGSATIVHNGASFTVTINGTAYPTT